jgi:hypothetical protein
MSLVSNNDRAKATRYRQHKLIQKSFNEKAEKVNNVIVNPVAQTALNAVKKSQQYTTDIGIGALKDMRRKGKEYEQFASKAAKTVIDDVQGVAKMFFKGFGN